MPAQVSFLLAASVTWAFAIISLADPNAVTYFADGKKWVAQNFTWLYIGAPRGSCLAWWPLIIHHVAG